MLFSFCFSADQVADHATVGLVPLVAVEHLPLLGCLHFSHFFHLLFLFLELDLGFSKGLGKETLVSCILGGFA